MVVVRIGMARGDLDVAQRNASVKRRHDEGCSKHVREFHMARSHRPTSKAPPSRAEQRQRGKDSRVGVIETTVSTREKCWDRSSLT
jgi:hypothetical protein